MKKLNKIDELFIQKIKAHCKEYGIKVDLRNTKYLILGKNVKCAGYFDHENRKLVCAMNRPDSMQILVHEYAHFTQWVDQCKAWTNLGKDGKDSLTLLFDWLDGKNIRNISRHVAICRDMELDNEKRSIKLIEKNKLNINIEDYTKRANAYVMFYNYMLISRRWSKPSNSPYKNKRIIEVMSPKFNMQYKKPSKKLMNLYESEGI
jgi:hypothetical protein